MTYSRRTICTWALVLAPLSVAAQTYPTKPVVLVVPFAPGGSTDLVARILADGLSKELGSPVVVENKAGAGGAVGARAVAAAEPNGYTLGFATVSTHVINPAIRGASVLKYDPIKDFTLITQVAAVPNVISVNPSVPARNMAEFLAYARANPGKLNFATPGNGSLGHMMGETTKYEGRIFMTHIPYRGAAPAMNDTISGGTQVFFDNLPSSLQQIQTGRLRALAVASPKRVSALPDVPTFAEAGLPLTNDAAWFGLVGPAGLPSLVQQRLLAATQATLRKPDVVKRLGGVMAEPLGNHPEEFRQSIVNGMKSYHTVIEKAQLKFE